VRGVRWGPGRRSLLKRRKSSDGIGTGAFKWSWDEPGGCLLTGQVVPGVEVT